MMSGYNTGGQPVKVSFFFSLSFKVWLIYFSPESLGAHQEIDHYARLRLYLPHSQVR